MPLEKATVLLVVGVTDFPVLDFLLGVFFGDDEWLWAWWVGEEVGGATRRRYSDGSEEEVWAHCQGGL